jgi:hypothetical protein
LNPTPFDKIIETFVFASQNTNSFYRISRDDESSFAKKRFVSQGFIPLHGRVAGAFPLFGESPFWLLRQKEIEFHIANGFLNLSDKTVPESLYVTCHYLDEPRKTSLQKIFGTQTGTGLQFALSSPRVVLVEFEKNCFCVKFSGAEIEKIKPFSDRNLNHEKILLTKALNQALDRNLFIEESSGYTINFKNPEIPDLSALFRFFPPMISRKENSVMLPLFTYFSKMTASLNQSVFGSFAERKIEWLESELVPKFLKLIWQAFETSGLHPEVHQQNINLVSNDGIVERLFYHDSCDLLQDPLYQSICLDIAWPTTGARSHLPACGEYGHDATPFNSFLSHWYKYFLEDFGHYDECISENMTTEKNARISFSKLFKNAFAEKVAPYLKPDSDPRIQNLPEHEVLLDPNSDLYMLLNAFRDFRMKTALIKKLESSKKLSMRDVKELLDKSPASPLLFTFGFDLEKCRKRLDSDEFEIYLFSNFKNHLNVFMFVSTVAESQIDILGIPVEGLAPHFG